MSQSEFPKNVRPLIFAGLMALLLLGMGAAVYNGGWSQGYTMGLLTGAADGSHLTPYLAYQAGGWHGGGFGFLGAIFRIVFAIFLFGLFFKFLGFMHWRMHGGQGPWQRGHGPWGQQGPWQQQGQPQQPSQPEPGSGQPQPGQQPGQTGPSGPQPTSWTQV